MLSNLTESQQQAVNNWIKKATTGFFRAKKIAEIRETAQYAILENLEARCPDHAPTDDDIKAVLDELGDPYMFGANFLSERHCLLNPLYYQNLQALERWIFSNFTPFFLLIALGMFVFSAVDRLFNETLQLDYSLGEIVVYILCLVAIAWIFCYALASLVCLPGVESSCHLYDQHFDAKTFVTNHDGFTMQSSGFSYMVIKLLVVLAPVMFSAMSASPRGYTFVFAAIAIFFLTAVIAEWTVRRIYQCRMPTFLTRIGTDLVLLLCVTLIALRLDHYPDLYSFSDALTRRQGWSSVIALSIMAVFLIYITFDILFAMSRLYYCHRQNVRTEHPAIFAYLNHFGYSVPADKRQAIKREIESRIADQLAEQGYDLNPDNATLIRVLEEIGSPSEAFAAYAVPRPLVAKEHATRCIGFNKIILLATPITLAMSIFFVLTDVIYYESVGESILIVWFLMTSALFLLNLNVFRTAARISPFIHKLFK